MKNLTIIAIFFFAFTANAQIKVGSNGNVNIGPGSVSSTYDLKVIGKGYFNDQLLFDANYCGLFIEEDSYGDAGLRPYCSISCTLGSSSYQFYKIYGRYIYQNGSLVTSDSRLKTNFKDILSPLDKIKLLRGQKYDFKTDFAEGIENTKKREEIIARSKNRLGFLAQEVMQIIPEACCLRGGRRRVLHRL